MSKFTSKIASVGLTAITVVSLSGFAVAPAVAQTSTDIQAQITSLLAQIASLQSQLGTGTSTGTTACTFTRSLTVGSKGADVTCLQTYLKSQASANYPTAVAATGHFGSITKAAVSAWQAANAVSPAAGFFGTISRAKYVSMGGSVVTPTTPTAPVVTGPVVVALASSNPASGNVVDGQATADLTRFTFSGNGTVNSVTLKRSGISDSNALRNVYLYDGVTRLTDGHSFNNAGEMVMTNLNIAVNGTRTISVMADVATGASATNASIAVALTSYTAGASVNAVNLVGNTHSFVVGGSLASATLQANTVPTTASVNAGISAYTFWSAPLQVSTRSVQLKSAAFRMVGSAPSDAIQNIKLFVNGVDTGKVAAITVIQGSNYAMFDLASAPITLTTGTQTIDVRGNVVKGSARTVQFSVQQAADLMLTDPQIGVNIAVLGTLPNAGGTISINAGSATLNLDPVFQAMTNITGGASNIAIGKFNVQAFGEDVKVNTLTVTPVLGSMTPTAAGLDDVTLFFNGSPVGTQQDFTGTALTFNLGAQMIAAAGANSTLEVRANIRTATTNANYTAGSVAVTITAGSSNAQGQNSLNAVSFPTASVTGNTLTIQTGNLVVSINTGYANTNISPNTIGARIGSFVFQNQSSSESVRVTSLNVVLSGSTALTNLSALRTSETSGSGAVPVQPQASNTFSVDFTLAPGATRIIDIFANTGTATGVLVVNVNAPTIGAVATQANVGPVAAAQTFTIGGTVTGGQTVTATINGFPSVFTQGGGDTTTTTATGLRNAINANTNVNGTVIATSVAAVVTVTATTAGTAGNSVTTVAAAGTGFTNTAGGATMVGGSAGTAQIQTYTVGASIVTGNVYSVTINGTAVSYTALVTDTTATLVSNGLRAALLVAFPGNVPVAGSGTATFIVTAAVPGTAFTFTAGTAVVGSQNTTGTSISTLTTTSIGVSSNVSATAGPTTGQTITLLAGAVTNPPTFTASASASAQFVAASGGAADATKAVYNFQSTGGSSVVSELKFTATVANTITSVRVPSPGALASGNCPAGSVCAPVVGTIAYLTGLNLLVPQGGSGLNVDVFISYANTGINGLASGSTAGLGLTEVKFTSGGTTATFNPSAVASNTMTLVGSKPTVALTLPNNASGSSITGLIVGTRYVGDVRVTADTKGDVRVNTIALKFDGNTTTTTSDGVLIVKDSTGTVISTASNTITGTAQNRLVTVTFSGGGYTVTAGQTAVFKIELPVTAITGVAQSMATGLNTDTALFTWTDTAGNGSVAGQNASLILNFPTATVGMTN